MYCRNVSWFICIFVAVVVATNYSDPYTSTETSTIEPNQEFKETGATDLAALLDARDNAVVVLVAGDTRLLAHRAVLAARSPVFATMFRRIALEASSGQVAISDVEGPVLRRMLAYMYTLQAPPVSSMAPQLLAAAHNYGLPALKLECEQQVATQLSVETAAATAVLAVRHSSTVLRQAAIAFIKAHIFHVMATPGWVDAMRTQPEHFIEVNRLLTQLAEPTAKTSAPATADSRSTTTPATEPHADHTDVSADGGGSPAPTPTTQPPSDRGDRARTAASAAPPTAGRHTLAPEDAAVSVLRVPAAEDNGTTSTPTPAPTAATQPHSNYAGTLASASVVTLTAACSGRPANTSVVTLLRSLSEEEKNRRLIEAAKEGATEDLQALLTAGADVGARDGFSRTALHWAADFGHVEAARCLLEGNADVDARNNRQNTPLHFAAWEGHTAMVRLLLASRADPNARNQFESTPLHYAAQFGRADTVTALLEAGARVDARNYRQNTALHYAAESGHTAAVRLLLAASAYHSARNEWGRTPLHYAAEHGQSEAAAALLLAGASRAATADDGDTPLDVARQKNHQQLVDMLK